MIEKKIHFSFGKDRYTECGLDTWFTPVGHSQFTEIVTCETCLERIGFDVDGIDELLDQPHVIL